MEEIESHERYGPRGRGDRYVRSNTPPLEDRYQGAYDQLNRRVAKPEEARVLRVVNRTPDPWDPNGGVARPGPSRPSRRPKPWSADGGVTRPDRTRSSPRSSPPSSPTTPTDWRANHERFPTNVAGISHDDKWQQSSSIMRNAKYKPAPKDGEKILYNCDDATATRRNLGW